VSAHRTPGVNTDWLEELREMGVTISVTSLDITDKVALRKFYDRICKSWPPVVGVANGAMVLNDKLFIDMSYEDLEVVLRPKVIGSRNLNELIGDQMLDFFILFSSLTCVFGNAG
jgi:hybrid polyketide synthase/nonribosomal peptide synthetase ACE1